MNKTTLLLIAGLISQPAASAENPFYCSEHPGTLRLTCVKITMTKVNGDIREAPLFTGSARAGIEAERHSIAVDCANKIASLRDRNGINYGFGSFSSTPTMAAISYEMCSYPKAKNDPKLRMFGSR